MSTAQDSIAALPTALGSLSVNTPGGVLPISIQAGSSVFIVGRNGTGKSALVHKLVNSYQGASVYIPGSRPSYFEKESLSITPASRGELEKNLTSWDKMEATRWRSISGTSRNEKAVHDFQAAEIQYKVDAANDIAQHGATSRFIEQLQSGTSPLERVNTLFAQANLPVSLSIENGQLKAVRDGTAYSIAKMSDGERIALVLVAEVIAAKDGAVFFIDEPELHMHRAIVVPLIVALIAERPTCGFVICTHELELAAAVPSAQIVLVRSIQWADGAPAAWEIDLLDNFDGVPEGVRIDVLGARRKVLFVEGAGSSLDQPLYALLFPSVSVRSRDNCREVSRAVAGLRAVEALHRVQAFGLVDGDGMSAESIAEMEVEGVYALPSYSVESLYYCAEARMAVSEQHAKTIGIDSNVLTAEAKARAIEVLGRDPVKKLLASRLAERKLRDAVLRAVPRREQLTSGELESVTLEIPLPYGEELERIEALLLSQDLETIVERYPVRESGVLNEIARALRFSGRLDFERAVLTRVRLDEDLRNALKGKLGGLALQLG